MKRKLPVLAATLAVAAFVATTADARDLIYGSWVSHKHPVMSGSLPLMFKGVDKDTGGAIKWKMVAGGQLMNGRATVAGVRDGIADAGMPIPSYTPSDLPATNSIFSTLVFGEDIVAAGGASAETLLLQMWSAIERAAVLHRLWCGTHQILGQSAVQYVHYVQRLQ